MDESSLKSDTGYTNQSDTPKPAQSVMIWKIVLFDMPVIFVTLFGLSVRISTEDDIGN